MPCLPHAMLVSIAHHHHAISKIRMHHKLWVIESFIFLLFLVYSSSNNCPSAAWAVCLQNSDNSSMQHGSAFVLKSRTCQHFISPCHVHLISYHYPFSLTVMLTSAHFMCYSVQATSRSLFVQMCTANYSKPSTAYLSYSCNCSQRSRSRTFSQSDWMLLCALGKRRKTIASKWAKKYGGCKDM